MGEGCSEVVVRVCKIINEGDSAAIRTEPLVYLQTAPSEFISRKKSPQ